MQRQSQADTPIYEKRFSSRLRACLDVLAAIIYAVIFYGGFLLVVTAPGPLGILSGNDGLALQIAFYLFCFIWLVLTTYGFYQISSRALFQFRSSIDWRIKITDAGLCYETPDPRIERSVSIEFADVAMFKHVRTISSDSEVGDKHEWKIVHKSGNVFVIGKESPFNMKKVFIALRKAAPDIKHVEEVVDESSVRAGPAVKTDRS